ncbi:MAG: hypothetical protein AB7I30_11985 [Isosphaeraceae bacterium]
MSVAGLLGLVACAALNIWLFRVSVLAGIIGLNVTKHVVIAYVCQVLGVNRQGKAGPMGTSPQGPGIPLP